jgi:orotate phosphoribosyltransferase
MPLELEFVRAQLRTFMRRTGAVQYSGTLDFSLASGQKSNAYCDARLLACDSEARFYVGHALQLICPVVNYSVAGGMEVGAVPVADALADAVHRSDGHLRTVWVRKKPKGHGTGQWIADLKKDERLDGVPTIVVEDTFTTGNSTMQAVNRLRDVGADVKAVIGIVDREVGARKLFEGEGLYFAAIFTLSELLPDGFVLRTE